MRAAPPSFGFVRPSAGKRTHQPWRLIAGWWISRRSSEGDVPVLRAMDGRGLIVLGRVAGEGEATSQPRRDVHGGIIQSPERDWPLH